MPKSSHYANADLAMGGQLGPWLLTRKRAGLSLSKIAAELFAEHGILVSPPTIKAWVAMADEPTNEVAA